jgi:hypothetical protein
MGLFMLLVKKIPYGENNYQALCLTNNDLAKQVTIMGAGECFLSLMEQKWRRAYELNSELFATQKNPLSLRSEDALAIMPGLRESSRTHKPRVAFSDTKVPTAGPQAAKPSVPVLGELKMVSDVRPESRVSGRVHRETEYTHEDRSVFRDAGLQTDLERKISSPEEKEESELLESKVDDPQEDYLRVMARTNGICYKFFYYKSCTEGFNCRWSHEQADYDRHWEKVAADFFRMAGPRLDEATAQGKLQECLQSMKPSYPVGGAGGGGGRGNGQQSRPQGGGSIVLWGRGPTVERHDGCGSQDAFLTPLD